jgi:predicted small lipoprotein YifL
MKWSIRIALLCVVAIAIAGCGSESPSSAPSADTPAVQDSGDNETTSQVVVPKGQWGRSGTIDGRVDSVKTASSITYIGNAVSETTPDGKNVTKKAGGGASYVFVRATVKNDGKDGIDLTCGGLVRPKLMDANGRKYTSVESVDQLRGNPECNVNLDPGFKDTITWAYRVPDDATPKALEFIDDTNFEKEQKPVFLGIS